MIAGLHPVLSSHPDIFVWFVCFGFAFGLWGWVYAMVAHSRIRKLEKLLEQKRDPS